MNRFRYFGKFLRYPKDGVMHLDLWQYDRVTGKRVMIVPGLDTHEDARRVAGLTPTLYAQQGLHFAEKVPDASCIVKMGKEQAYHDAFILAVVNAAKAKAASAQAAVSEGSSAVE